MYMPCRTVGKAYCNTDLVSSTFMNLCNVPFKEQQILRREYFIEYISKTFTSTYWTKCHGRWKLWLALGRPELVRIATVCPCWSFGLRHVHCCSAIAESEFLDRFDSCLMFDSHEFFIRFHSFKTLDQFFRHVFVKLWSDASVSLINFKCMVLHAPKHRTATYRVWWYQML